MVKEPKETTMAVGEEEGVEEESKTTTMALGEEEIEEEPMTTTTVSEETKADADETETERFKDEVDADEDPQDYNDDEDDEDDETENFMGGRVVENFEGNSKNLLKNVTDMNLILKSLLFACLFYILAHYETKMFLVKLFSMRKRNYLYVATALFLVVYYVLNIVV